MAGPTPSTLHPWPVDKVALTGWHNRRNSGAAGGGSGRREGDGSVCYCAWGAVGRVQWLRGQRAGGAGE
jgi:hypothetical protein